MRRATVLRGHVAFIAGVLIPCTAVAAPGVVPTPGPVVSHGSSADPARGAYRALTPRQRLGQLFMAGVPAQAPAAATLTRLRRLGVGGVILDGNSSAGRDEVKATTTAITASLAQTGIAPFIATDQEGGEVQRFTGRGFSRMPTALRQGAWSTDRLQHASTHWGHQLAAAGLNLNLAPVADTVPRSHARANQPIGRYDREYGHAPAAVASHVAAVVRGESRHVAVTLKHFPGLGRATGNTDLTTHVTDPTTRHDRYLAPFRRGVAAGARFVMVSLASYPRIDPGRPACFSSAVMKSMLRGDLHFDGVVISDSFHAAAVRAVPPAKAAVRFFRAGGTMLLDTDDAPLRAMEDAILSRVKTHPAFAAAIQADVMKVLRAKAEAGLLPGVQR